MVRGILSVALVACKTLNFWRRALQWQGSVTMRELRNQLLSGVSAMHLLASDLEFLAVSHEFLSDMRLLHTLMCGTDTNAAAFGGEWRRAGAKNKSA